MSASVFQDLRLDIATLRELIDHSLDKGVPNDDPLLKACATVFAHKRERLQLLEAATWKRLQDTG
jgi:hypothetical protein